VRVAGSERCAGEGELALGISEHGASLSGGGENVNIQALADFGRQACLPGWHLAGRIGRGRPGALRSGRPGAGTGRAHRRARVKSTAVSSDFGGSPKHWPQKHRVPGGFFTAWRCDRPFGLITGYRSLVTEDRCSPLPEPRKRGTTSDPSGVLFLPTPAAHRNTDSLPLNNPFSLLRREGRSIKKGFGDHPNTIGAIL
jgi:hypothetical protein